VSDERRVRRAGIVAALGHVLVIYWFASLPPRAAVSNRPVATAADAGMTPVEMVIDPVSFTERSAERTSARAATTSRPPAVTEGATSARAARPRHQRNGDRSLGEIADSPPEPNDGFSPLEEPGMGVAGLPRLSLAQSVELAPEGAPAPSHTPRARTVSPEDTNESVRASVRDRDRALGLGAPQERSIAAALREAGRASGVPSGTRFVVRVVLDGDGKVTSAAIRG